MGFLYFCLKAKFASVYFNKATSIVSHLFAVCRIVMYFVTWLNIFCIHLKDMAAKIILEILKRTGLFSLTSLPTKRTMYHQVLKHLYIHSPSIMQQLFIHHLTLNTTCFGHRWPTAGVLMYRNCYTALMCTKTARCSPLKININNWLKSITIFHYFCKVLLHLIRCVVHLFIVTWLFQKVCFSSLFLCSLVHCSATYAMLYS
jgi:hypothetical protein